MAEQRIIRNLPLALGRPVQELRALGADAIGVPRSQIPELRPLKVSIDARGQKRPQRRYTVEVWLQGEPVPPHNPPTARRPTRMRPRVTGEMPLIVGTGPAGLWAALRFVEAGQPVVLIDRGLALDQRHRGVVSLRRRGVLDTESNLCYGEGGAGTYSDGKLYTRVRDPRVRRIYEDLVAFGGDPDLLIDAHPHVGTNQLIKLLATLRTFLQEAGCEYRFGARVVDLIRAQDGHVRGVRLADGETLEGSAVILATGHSARDVYSMLHGLGAPMEAKALAIGARVEHPQELIDEIQYGRWAGQCDLEAAAYAVTARVENRGVYSFCMCPGGFVIPTPTESEHLNVNGMSNANRGGRFANSALVVTVEPADFWCQRPGDLDHHGPLAGIAFQRHLERTAFMAGGGGYRAPAQRLTDFLRDREGDLPSGTSYRPGLTARKLSEVLPARLHRPLARALGRFDRKMPGFVTKESNLIAVETTTSSPVRVLRDPKTLVCPTLPGLYPCGEGAGWAGGIVSSAIDGIRVAEAVLSG